MGIDRKNVQKMVKIVKVFNGGLRKKKAMQGVKMQKSGNKGLNNGNCVIEINRIVYVF